MLPLRRPSSARLWPTISAYRLDKLQTGVGDTEWLKSSFHRLLLNLPAESGSGLFGGNSNWRGPAWMPVNVLIIRALLQYHEHYGNEFKIECPTGSGRHMNLLRVAEELWRTGRRGESIGRNQEKSQ